MPGVYFPVQIAVIGLLEKDGKYLLHKRNNTSWRSGWYSLPGGRAEGKESLKTALIRELREEIGIEALSDDLELVHIFHLAPKVASDEFIYHIFRVKKWAGDPFNAEPNKCTEVSWYPKENMPEKTVPIIKSIVIKIENGENYSEYGWKESETESA